MNRQNYLKAAAVILAATAFTKFISAMGSQSILIQIDPLFTFLNYREMVLIAAVLETMVLAIILSNLSQTTKLLAVAWLSTVFAGYRLGLWWIGTTKQCPCLGNAWAWLKLKPETLEQLAFSLLLFLLLGSYLLLLKGARVGLKTASPSGVSV